MAGAVLIVFGVGLMRGAFNETSRQTTGDTLTPQENRSLSLLHLTPANDTE